MKIKWSEPEVYDYKTQKLNIKILLNYVVSSFKKNDYYIDFISNIIKFKFNVLYIGFCMFVL